MSSYWDKRSNQIERCQGNFVSDYANSVMSHIFRNLDRDFGCVFKTDLWDEGVAVERKVLGGVLVSPVMVGCDVSKVTCKRVSDKRISIFNGDIRCLPLKSGVFGLIVDNSTIDHVFGGDVWAVLSEYERLLVDGGWIVLVVAQRNPFSVFYHRGVVEGVNFVDGDYFRDCFSNFFGVYVDRCHNLLGFLLPVSFFNRVLFHLPVWVRGVFLRYLEWLEFSFFSSLFKGYGGFRVMVGVKR